MAKGKMLTYYMSGGINEVAGGSFVVPSVDTMVAQENILICGWDYSLKLYVPTNQDGWSDAYFELSQAPTQTKSGGLLGVRIQSFAEAIGVSGGAGLGSGWDHGTFMFPVGNEITLAEGDYLNLHCAVETNVGLVARMDAAVRVYHRTP